MSPTSLQILVISFTVSFLILACVFIVVGIGFLLRAVRDCAAYGSPVARISLFGSALFAIFGALASWVALYFVAHFPH